MNEINNIDVDDNKENNNNNNETSKGGFEVLKQRSMSITDLLNDRSFGCGHNGNNTQISQTGDIRDILKNVELPLTLHKSSIVYMFENNDDQLISKNGSQNFQYFDQEHHDKYLKEKCRQIRVIINKLCDKYIFGKGDFQINISYSIRSEFDLLIGSDQTEWIKNQSISCEQLYTIFDSCIIEMYQLMTHSVRRFTKTSVKKESIEPFNLSISIYFIYLYLLILNMFPIYLNINRNIRKSKQF